MPQRALLAPVRALAASAAAGAAVLALAGCGGMAANRSLDSVRQPLVEQQDFTIDLAAGPGGLGYGEQQRLDDWFDALRLGHGDSVALHDPAGDPVTRETIAALAGGRGALLASAVPLPAMPPGIARVVVTRSRAYVPGCPDWSAKSDINFSAATYPNYGCAVNGNLAAMVADTADLIRGVSDPGSTVTMTGTKAIEAYRAAPPTGTQGLRSTSSAAGAGGSGGGSGQ